MIVLTRYTDTAELIKMLTDIIQMMGEDLAEIGCVSADDVIDSYVKCCAGPTVLESILIQRGVLSEEDVTRNYLIDWIKRENGKSG